MISTSSPCGGGAEEGQVVGVLGVVVVEQAARGEGVVDAVADGVAQLGLGHAPVQGEGGDEVDVVDAGVGGQVEHRLDDPLADVGPAHRRQRQADVVEGDRELHAREQQRGQRVAVERVEQRVADGAVDVVERRQRLGRVDDPAAAGGQLLEPEALAVLEQDRRRRAVDVEDESGTGHQMVPLSFSSRRSKAILTAPRRPAAAAWAMAST